jgi:hypothetical protein
VGAKHGENVITGIMTTFEGRKIGEQLKILIDIAIIYYITEFKHSERSILGNTALTTLENIRYIFKVCTVAQ